MLQHAGAGGAWWTPWHATRRWQASAKHDQIWSEGSHKALVTATVSIMSLYLHDTHLSRAVNPCKRNILVRPRLRYIAFDYASASRVSCFPLALISWQDARTRFGLATLQTAQRMPPSTLEARRSTACAPIPRAASTRLGSRACGPASADSPAARLVGVLVEIEAPAHLAQLGQRARLDLPHALCWTTQARAPTLRASPTPRPCPRHGRPSCTSC